LKKEASKSQRGRRTTKDEEGEKNYLEFLAFGMKENLSFLQIQALGKFLKEMMVTNKVGFFKNSFFDNEELSEIARGLGICILEEITEDLSSNKFSFSIDSCTVHNKNICGLKVRYLKQSLDNKGLKKTSIESKMIGIKYLEESSEASVYYNIIQETLFKLDERIKNNLVGVAHDNANVLSGTKDGLMGLMNRDLQNYFFHLGDPCHDLNLALSQALEKFPTDVTKFVDQIHSHFAHSPQRISRLINLQKPDNPKPIGLKKYVKTRWLSLGQSLLRILEIWSPLEKYMEQNCQKIKQCNKFLEQLQNQSFKLEIIFLTGITSKINKSNQIYQSQRLEIQNLKIEMANCVKNIARLLIKDENLSTNILALKEIDCFDPDFQKQYCLDQCDFIERIITDIDIRLLKIKNLDIEEKNRLSQEFQVFLAELLSLLLKYLPVNNQVIDLLDFVTINPSTENLKSKILEFNNLFGIVPFSCTKELSEEIDLLCNEDILWARLSAKGSSLYLWDLIEGTSETIEGISKYPFLSLIFRTAHSLPTSSAGLEQSFSNLKLVKNALRSNLIEETTQALILISEKYQDNPIEISEKMIEKYNKIIERLNQRKSLQKVEIKESQLPEEEKENVESQGLSILNLKKADIDWNFDEEISGELLNLSLEENEFCLVRKRKKTQADQIPSSQKDESILVQLEDIQHKWPFDEDGL